MYLAPSSIRCSPPALHPRANQARPRGRCSRALATPCGQIHARSAPPTPSRRLLERTWLGRRDEVVRVDDVSRHAEGLDHRRSSGRWSWRWVLSLVCVSHVLPESSRDSSLEDEKARRGIGEIHTNQPCVAPYARTMIAMTMTMATQMPRQIHFFLRAARAFTVACSSWTFASTMCCCVSSACFSTFWIMGSCWTTIASRSWKSCASSIMVRSICWIASWRCCTERSVDWDWPRRSADRSACWKICVSPPASLTSRSSASVASGLTIRYWRRCCSWTSLRKADSCC